MCLSATLIFTAKWSGETGVIASFDTETSRHIQRFSGREDSNGSPVSQNPSVDKSDLATPTAHRATEFHPRNIEGDKVLTAFDQWVEEYLAASSPTELTRLEDDGEQLAKARRYALAELIETDPERALQEAVPFAKRQKLPGSIQQQLEERVSGTASYRVIASLPDRNAPQESPSIERYVTLNERTFKASVYGRRLTEPSKESIPVHGIAIGNTVALHESPVRVLEAGELSDPSLPLPANGGICPVSKSAGLQSAAVQVGDEVVYLCHDKHIETFTHDLEAQEAGFTPLTRQSDLSRSTGLKKVLLMRVNFPDDLSVSISDVDANEMMQQVNAFYIENSYGNVSISATVTPVLTLPNPKSYYLNGDADYTLRELLLAARTAAEAAGFPRANYDLDLVHNRACSPRAYVGIPGAMLYDKDVTAASHELGHNFGAWHANGWKASDGSIIGPGGNLEYANPFDTMGGGRKSHFNAYYKHQLGWLPDSAVQPVSGDGIYRLYPIDLSHIENGLTYALTIKKDNLRTYWIETRQSLNSSFPANVLLNWSPWYGSASGTQLLDATPVSHGWFYDAPFSLGQSFYDPDLGLKIIPWRATAEYVEVLVKHVHYLAFEAESVSAAPQGSSSSENGYVLISPDDRSPTAFGIDLPADGEYALSFQVQPAAGAKSLSLSVDNTEAIAIELSSTDSTNQWVWTRMNRPLLLTAGKHMIYLRADGGDVGLETFVVTDDPTQGLPPIIAKIRDQVATVGATIKIPLRITDPDSSEAPLGLTGASSNWAVLSGTAIVLSGSDQNWTATLTPKAGKTGQSVVTLTIAKPGGYCSATSFVLTVVSPGSDGLAASSTEASDLLSTRMEPNGDITILLSKPSRSSWKIEATEDFIFWQDLVDLTTSAAGAEFTDSSAHKFARRFYRAVAN